MRVKNIEELSEEEVEEVEDLLERDPDDLDAEERTSKARESLRKKYALPWLLVFELRNRDGRVIDAIAVDTRASRGCHIIGFEIKASRSDWQSELRNRDKADLWVQLCDEWYVVAAKRGIVEEDELPPGWGLLELKPKGALWEIVGSDLSDVQDRRPDRRFWANFMKKALEHEFRYKDLVEARKRGYKSRKQEENERSVDWDIQQMKKKAESYEKLQESEHINLSNRLDDGRIRQLALAEAIIHKIRSDRWHGLVNQVENVEDKAERLVEDVEEVRGGFDRLRELVEGAADER